jgi:hypothetical protein
VNQFGRSKSMVLSFPPQGSRGNRSQFGVDVRKQLIRCLVVPWLESLEELSHPRRPVRFYGHLSHRSLSACPGISYGAGVSPAQAAATAAPQYRGVDLGQALRTMWDGIFAHTNTHVKGVGGGYRRRTKRVRLWSARASSSRSSVKEANRLDMSIPSLSELVAKLRQAENEFGQGRDLTAPLFWKSRFPKSRPPLWRTPIRRNSENSLEPGKRLAASTRRLSRVGATHGPLHSSAVSLQSPT